MKSGSVLMTLILLFTLSVSSPALALQDDPVVIRGPVGSDQTDVRQGQERYGPITRSDTLWSIANRVRPHSSVSVPQVMSAIVQANPHAFLDNNPNAMETGFILRIPSLQEIQMVNPQAAQRHIELGEQLQRSSERLQTTQAATEQTDAQRVALLNRTSDDARRALQEVRDEYADEFAELRQRLSRSIENTEAVVAANQALQERIDSITETLEDIQRTMVAENEFQAQIRELVDAQQSLRLEQREAREVEQSQGLANRIISNPLALILLAFVPALILIVIATLVLLRRDGQGEVVAAPAVSGSTSGSENVTAAGMVDSSESDSDDFELDEAMAEFDDLDDDDGDDLSALEDEMLVPDEEEDDSIQLDDDMDDLDLSEFDALETELGSDATDDELSDDEPADEQKGQPDDSDQALSQADLDELFAGDFDPDEDLDEPATATEETAPAQPNAEDDEPSPAELFASDADDDEPLDTESDAESMAASDDEFDMLGDDDEDDFDKMMAQFAEDDADEELDDDDIESLLAKSDALISASEAEQQEVTDDPDSATMDEDVELTEDSAEAVDIDAEEPLNFDATEGEDTSANEPAITNEPKSAAEDESDTGFIDIDDILDEAADEPEEDDEPQSKESRRADEEDNLAAQLDLARAYLEMDETEEARETIQGVIDQASGELLKEANELLTRLDG
ncbi:MAG: hypothetical protein JJU03_08160 [Idiomarina sp.]|nr:hypothetical protein [Idiomarina sp.]